MIHVIFILLPLFFPRILALNVVTGKEKNDYRSQIIIIFLYTYQHIPQV